MKTTARRDVHRPSAIQPEDYEFVAVHYIGGANTGLEEAMANAEARRIIAAHMKMTGGSHSRHEHGGTCSICGAVAMYLAVYYHPATNSYIECGEDCARKMDMGDVEAFNPLRRAMADARLAHAGKRKAQMVLAEAGLSRAWDLYTANGDPARIHELVSCGAVVPYKSTGEDEGGPTQYASTRPFVTLCDLVYKLVKYGSISDKQERFLASLLEQIDKAVELAAARQAEHDAAADCPTGRLAVTVEVIKTDWRESDFGDTLKMLARHADGWKIWGTVPRTIAGLDRDLQRGDRLELTVTLEPSRDDAKFGFYRRPTKARLLDSGTP